MANAEDTLFFVLPKSINSLLADMEDHWATRLFSNHFGYTVFIVPMVFLLLVSKTQIYTKWPEPIRGTVSALVRSFILDTSSNSTPDTNNRTASSANQGEPTSTDTYRKIAKLIFFFIGLQVSYLLWGLLQERIMTQTYDGEKFDNSQFLVFINRLLASFVAYVSFKILHPSKKILSTGPPFLKYGIISYANCMSTWFQYESLLYISFPVQVIAKSIKTIPVMIVGKFVSGKTYPCKQYLSMLIMASGIALFLSGYQESSADGKVVKKARQNITKFNGVVLLICYLAFDAFTSNYQKKIFDVFQISSFHMMFFVNVISTLFTITSMLFNNTLFDCILFMQHHRLFAMHALATSLCSAIGQLFIFSTIEEFGPVVFTIIMTLRQAFSIILSCIFYGHQLTWYSIVGIHIAFGAILAPAFLHIRSKKKQSTTNHV